MGVTPQKQNPTGCPPVLSANIYPAVGFTCRTMNVQIQSVKFDADKKLIEFVELKMSKLDRFADRATGAEVILKLDKDHEKGNKVATITLRMPGDELVAEGRSQRFEEAVDEAIDALKRQLEKFKEKAYGK